MRPVSRMHIDMLAPEATRAMIRESIALHDKAAVLAREIFLGADKGHHHAYSTVVVAEAAKRVPFWVVQVKSNRTIPPGSFEADIVFAPSLPSATIFPATVIRQGGVVFMLSDVHETDMVPLVFTCVGETRIWPSEGADGTSAWAEGEDGGSIACCSCWADVLPETLV